MASTFFGLNIANTGINAYQASINTTSNNIANVETEGYSRQTTNLSASSALRTYTAYGSTSTGVTVDSVTRDRNEYYDTKYWNNNAVLGLNSTKLEQFQEIETYFVDDDTQTGFSTIFSEMFSAMDSMKDNAGDRDYRTQFIAQAQNLCDYFTSVSTSLKDQQVAINDEIKTCVDNINAIAQKVATLNKEINVIEVSGGNANELRDERTRLLDDLSSYVPIEYSENPVLDARTGEESNATTCIIKINGQILVDTYNYNTLQVVPRDYLANQSDAEGLYDIEWSATGISFDANSGNNSGILKGLFDVRDGNNRTNVSGIVSAAEGNTITISRNISDDSTFISDPLSMNLPESGKVTIKGLEFYYSSFEAELDENGEISSYTFYLDQHTLTSSEKNSITGKELSVGEAIDCMGIPYYQNQLNNFLRNFAKAFNEIEEGNETLDGEEMGAFFVANLKNNTKSSGTSECEFDDEGGTTITSTSHNYYQLTAQNVSVNERSRNDASYFSCASTIDNGVDAYDVAEQLLKLQKDVTMFRGGSAESFLQCIYSDISVDTQEAKLFTDNFESLKETITNQRDSVSSVDTDDEALDLVKFQNAYNLSCKVISVLQEMYDQLILNTGV